MPLSPDLDLLKKYWGYTTFRPLQEEIISSVLSGRDTLALMPTGGGKSITFQLPTLMQEGMCLVVTPLIALMKDQVRHLHERHIKATALYLGMTREEMHTALENCLYGDYKFLYLSPERLNTELFLSYLPRLRVSLIAVDEAHCISQWGYDFRPPYLDIASIRPYFPQVPILALTATATPQVVEDIQEKLHFKAKNVLQKSFVRENLSYVVRETENKTQELLHILSKVKGTAIVYVRSRDKTREICNLLLQNGFSATYYHAGLTRQKRDERQKLWTQGDCPIMVATNAFGMGIDKADVRLVVHISPPESLEEYFQEAGRAGRDGHRSYAVFLYGPTDQKLLSKRLTDHYPSREFIKNIYERLGSYLQVAQESGMGMTFEFLLENFAKTYHLPSTQVYYSLKLLEQAGYIRYNEEGENASRIHFVIGRDELYKLHELSPTTERLVQTLLRGYSGLFSEYIYVNEGVLSEQTGIDRQTQYECLKQLAHLRILSYIPQRTTPSLTYTRQREDVRRVIIPSSIYEERQRGYEERLHAVRLYLQNREVCRSMQLIEYFGEKSEGKECGICDVCLKKKGTSSLEKETFLSIQRACLFKLKDSSLSMEDLLRELPFSEEKILRVVSQLLESGVLQREGEGPSVRYSLKEGAT